MLIEIKVFTHFRYPSPNAKRLKMTLSKKAPAPFNNLFGNLKNNHDSRKHLQEAVQLAIQIEFTTIPAYLTALYSIQDVSSNAYQLLRSVVMEEMFHANQAANLLVAIGGQPLFTGKAVPVYPNYLPHANPYTTPYIGLNGASISVFGDVFAAIEEPATYDAPPEANNYDTIAQVYKSILVALESYSGSEPLFKHHHGARQRTNIYPGKFGGNPIEIKNMKDAKLGIQEIMEQGEGSVPESGAYDPVQNFGVYNHYGHRTDGTYGPILGVPAEMSHFKKFRSIALDTANFPATYPIISNPREEDFKSNKLLQVANSTFNYAYSIMLEALENSFKVPVDKNEPDQFYAVVLPVMHQVLPSLARLLMNTPLRPDGDAGAGPNGAPTFKYLPGCHFKDLSAKMKQVLDLAKPAATENNSLGVIVSALAEAYTEMKTIK